MTSLESAAAAVRRAITESCSGLVDREVVVELVALSAVAREHMLLIGPPGTAKSEAVRRIARNLGGSYFEYLLGRFTEPNEIFGPVNLNKLKQGIVETETTGMLPEAEIAFLDEVFQGSTAILNTLLAVLNERTFRRGHTTLSCPLRVCVGASNRLPTDEHLAAFADRFLVRAFVAPIGDSRLEELLAGGWLLTRLGTQPIASIEDLDLLADAALAMDLSAIRSTVAHALRLLRGAGIVLTDRRATRVQRLVAGAAALAGRPAPTEADLWPIVFAIPAEKSQGVAREVLRDLLAPSHNPALSAAAAESSQGPRARAARIVSAGRAILQARPDAEEEQQAWRLKLEAVAREVDAGFAADAMPAELRELRAELVQHLAPLPVGTGEGSAGQSPAG
jgi:MoxR-like ATPase